MAFFTDFSEKTAKYNAFDWNIIAAQLGDGWAQFELGLMYSQVTTRNLAKAIYWLTKASSCGDKRVVKCAERELKELKKETYL